MHQERAAASPYSAEDQCLAGTLGLSGDQQVRGMPISAFEEFVDQQAGGKAHIGARAFKHAHRCGCTLDRPNTTHRYVEANLAMEQKALARIQEPNTVLRRFRPAEPLLHFLQQL